MYRNGGLIPRGPSGGNYTFVMTGASSTPLFVSAWQKGIRDFDVALAYEGVHRNHLPGGLQSKAGYEHHTCIGGGLDHYLAQGFIPLGVKADAYHLKGAAQTLEYASEDWTLSQWAAVLGQQNDAAVFAKRSTNWKNLWDRESGFLRPRQADGSWLTPFEPMSPEGWVEGNGWQYLFRVTHEISGFADRMGGSERAIERLDRLMRDAAATGFTAPHDKHHLSPLDFGNQPSTFSTTLVHPKKRNSGSAKSTRHASPRSFRKAATVATRTKV